MAAGFACQSTNDLQRWLPFIPFIPLRQQHFDWKHGARIGEASHPGPGGSKRLEKSLDLTKLVEQFIQPLLKQLVATLVQQISQSFGSGRQYGTGNRCKLILFRKSVQEFVPLCESQQWAFLSGAHLRAAAHGSRNRAAGIDGRTAFELSLFSAPMWDAVADFYNHHCLRYGKVPEIWKHFRQVHIGKENGSSEESFWRADQLRPISVSSLMWRVCQKAQYCHSDAQLWINQTFPDYLIGGTKGRGTDQAISKLLFRAQQGWHVATLDLAKAFDCTSPKMAGLILQRLGFPIPVLSII